MNISRREGPFVADITGGLLTARRDTSAEGWGMSGAHVHVPAASGPLFILPVADRPWPWFVLHGDRLYSQSAHNGRVLLYRGENAAQLLHCLSGLLTTSENKRLRGKKVRAYGCALVAGCLTGVWLAIAAMDSGSHPPMPVYNRPVFQQDVAAARYAPAEPEAPPLMPARDVQHGSPVYQKPSPPLRQPPNGMQTDGWDLPANVRAGLPAKLHNAASRGLFTVPLSGGHARTIYVFADPACANCQRMERHVESAAGSVNVVVFPVTTEGREASLKTLTPVMMLPEAERATAWKRLFSADAGTGVPGDVQASADDTQAETARGAIGVNEVAFRAYRLPGTPWTISDDGRYVPQSVLASPTALADFLNGGGHD